VPRKVNALIVGAGFAGATLAERLASQLGWECVVAEKRGHIGGNSMDRYDAAGVLVHAYGPHYFRSNSDRVVEYLGQFTEWHPVEYKILSWTDGDYWPFPVNLNTFEKLVGRPSSSEEMVATLEKWRVPVESPKNSEECIVSQVGWELYEKFFKGYTLKQWKREPKDLDASVCGRIPIRTNRDDRYLSEKFQALPSPSYTRLFEKMLSHPRIEVLLSTDYRDVASDLVFDRLIYTGSLDEYFGYRFGPLPYRSLRFEPETLPIEYFQPAMQVNYPNDHDFTRIVEIKHATGQKCPVTTIVREYPDDYGQGKERYYPIPAPDTAEIFRKYKELADQEKHVSFVGRLANYRYYNMDQVVAMALGEFEKIKGAAV